MKNLRVLKNKWPECDSPKKGAAQILRGLRNENRSKKNIHQHVVKLEFRNDFKKNQLVRTHENKVILRSKKETLLSALVVFSCLL